MVLPSDNKKEEGYVLTFLRRVLAVPADNQAPVCRIKLSLDEYRVRSRIVWRSVPGMPLLAGEDFPGVNLKKIDGVVLSVDRSMRVIIRLDTAVKHDSTFPPTNLIGVPLRDLIDPFKATFSVDYDTMPQRGGEKT